MSSDKTERRGARLEAGDDALFLVGTYHSTLT